MMSLCSVRQRTSDFAPKAASCCRCQPEIACASIGHTHGRTNFKISSMESLLRETEQSGREAARRSRRRSCRCKPMQIQRENRQRDCSRETVSSTRTNTVETTLFEVVYRRLNRRMLLSSKLEIFLSFPFHPAQLPLSRQGIEHFIKSVGRTVESALQARRVLLLRITNQPLHRHLSIISCGRE